eukprot:3171241-Pyramimonas_sp.AAC.1
MRVGLNALSTSEHQFEPIEPAGGWGAGRTEEGAASAPDGGVGARAGEGGYPAGAEQGVRHQRQPALPAHHEHPLGQAVERRAHAGIPRRPAPAYIARARSGSRPAPFAARGRRWLGAQQTRLWAWGAGRRASWTSWCSLRRRPLAPPSETSALAPARLILLVTSLSPPPLERILPAEARRLQHTVEPGTTGVSLQR